MGVGYKYIHLSMHRQYNLHSQYQYPKSLHATKLSSTGILSTQPIPAGSLIFQIPSRFTIMEQTLPVFLKECRQLDGEEKILLMLISLKMNRDRIGQEWMREWIGRSSYGLIGLARQAIENSDDCQLLLEYLGGKKQLQREFEAMKNRASNLKEIFQFLQIDTTSSDFQTAYMWAFEFRRTRAFGYTKDTMLIPLFDCLNYDPSQGKNVQFFTYRSHEDLQAQIASLKQQNQAKEGQKSEVQEQQNRTFVNDESEDEEVTTNTEQLVGIVAIKGIEEGQQLFLDYGRLGNRSLLKHYGYSVRHNPHSYLQIFVSTYKRPQMIYYSAIQRPLLEIWVKRGKVCNKLLKFWQKVHDSSQQESLLTLIEQLKKKPPPTMKQPNQTDEHLWIHNYQQDNIDIYHEQIHLLQKLTHNIPSEHPQIY